MSITKPEHIADLCIIGGGLAGTIAAISAARKGVKVVLIQDRPVLEGNASSEIKMWVGGAKGYCNKETGILAEFEEENICRNPTLAATLWNSVLFAEISCASALNELLLKKNSSITFLSIIYLIYICFRHNKII